MIEDQRRELFVCSCGDIEHQFVVSSFNDEPELFVEMHLSDMGFFRRLWTGLKFIFGKKSIYGSFEEIILKPKDIERLRDILNQKIKLNNEQA